MSAKALVIAISGIVSLTVTSLALGWLEAFGFSLYSLAELRLSWLAILPIGGITTGVAAGSGYYVAGTWLKAHPTTLELAQLLLAAAAAPLLVLFNAYFRLTEDLSLERFASFLHYYVTATSLEIESAQTPELGPLGYLYFGVQFTGSLAGAYFLANWWKRKLAPQ